MEPHSRSGIHSGSTGEHRHDGAGLCQAAAPASPGSNRRGPTAHPGGRYAAPSPHRRDQARKTACRREDLRHLLPHRRQLVDGEEATVIDLLTCRAKRGETVRLSIQQPVEGIEAARRSLGSPLKTRTVSAKRGAASGQAVIRSASRRLATICSRRRSGPVPDQLALRRQPLEGGDDALNSSSRGSSCAGGSEPASRARPA